MKVFINEGVGSFPFFDRKGAEFSYLGNEGFIKVDGMVIGLRWGNMVSGLLQENLSKFCIFCREGFPGFCCFSLHCKICGHGQFMDCGSGSGGEELQSALLDVIDDIRIHSSSCELFWKFCVKVSAKTGLLFVV